MRKLLVACVLAATFSAGCNPPASADVTAQDIAQVHEGHGHQQWRGGSGTELHTWPVYQYEAAALRNYLKALWWARVVAYVRASYHSDLVWHWSGVAECESGGNWAINTGNGYYGGLQFTLGTWQAHGGVGMPNEQSAGYQSMIADRVRIANGGTGDWPVCGRYYR